jgi:hypothetical protein
VTDDTATFNTKAFAWVDAIDTWTTEANSTATQVNTDAGTATAQAVIATTKAGEASASADLAEDWATKTDGYVSGTDNSAKSWATGGTGDGIPSGGSAKDWATKISGEVAGGEFSAKKYAQDSSTSADAAAASAVEAAGLVENYQGALASDPSLNKDGGALAAGDWYVNTTTGLIRAYDGSGWVTSVNVTAGVESLNGQTGVVTGFVTETDTQTLTNKTIDGNLNTITNVSSPEIKTPTNVSPANASTDIGETPALTGSTYYSLYGITMAAGQWQVSTVSDFASTVVDTGDVAGTSVTYNVSSGVLSVNTTYYWRVRYKDANGTYSEWSTATTFTTAASFGPNIGDAYAGGFYAGDIVQGGTTYRIVVAPKSSGENSSKQWKTSSDAGPSATQTLNNGPAASSSMNSATYPAAQFCEGLSIGGFSDWYLPARDELELCYRNLKPTTDANNTSARPLSGITYPEGNDVSGDTMGINRNSDPTGAAYTSGNPAQTSVTAFQTGNTEAFASAYYWSSSEYSLTNAWRQYFVNGFQDATTKPSSGNVLYVRAVRRVAV